MEKEVLRVKIKTISPVHIGSAEVYEPTGFTLDTESNELTAFDPTDFISSLSESEKNELSEICKKGTIKSIIELYRFMRGKPANGKKVALPQDFTEHYKKILNLSGQDREIQQNLNQFIIERTSYRKNDNRPYIPGSSIKGSLRTAYLNKCAYDLKYPVNFQPSNILKNRWNNMKSEVLETRLISKNKKNLEKYKKNIPEDPFRLIKVSDFHPVEDGATKIYYCINRKKKENKEARGPYQILEAVQPGTEFIGTVTIEKPVNNSFIKTIISKNDIIDSIKFFFSKTLKDEKNIFTSYNTIFETTDDPQNIKVKLGRHSGAENVTVEGYRNIKIMRKDSPKFEKHSTTYWFASEIKDPGLNDPLYPLGWTEFKLLTEEEFNDYNEVQKDIEKLHEKELDYQRQKAEEKALAEAEEKRKLLEEKEKIEQEKEEKKKIEQEIENMPIGQKEVAILSRDNVDEQTVNTIFKSLDTIPDDYKLQVAEKIKNIYAKENKWTTNKKKVSKKQILKVKKLREILNEQ